MKHSSVRALIRTQFNIDPCIDIDVKFLSLIDDIYHFEVEWWERDTIRKQCNLQLPQIKCFTQVMNSPIPDIENFTTS